MNTIQPAEDVTHASRRVGYGIGGGLGKVGGCGHKGQKSRAGGFHKVGFGGGQMPLQHRLPKRGFKSLIAAVNAEVCLSELNLTVVNEIDILVLKRAGLIPTTASNVKVTVSDEVSRAVTLKGIKATKDAKAVIEAAGGKVKE